MSGKPSVSTRITFIALAVLVGAASAFSGESQAYDKPSHASGISGTIISTGNCPGPQRIDDTRCGPRPYEGMLAVKLVSSDKVVATFSSNSKGAFRVLVPPGKYIIIQAGESRYPIIHSDEIAVLKHKFTVVKLSADLGMR